MNTKFKSPIANDMKDFVLHQITDIVRDKNVAMAYLGGSPSVGLDTPTSDIDLYLILDNNDTQDVHMRQILVDGHRIDIEAYSIEQARAHINNIINWQATPSDFSAFRIDEDSIDFTIRLLYSTPVFESKLYSEITDLVVQNIPKIRQFLISYWSFEAAVFYEDFKGFILANDVISAAMIGSKIATATGKCICAANGDLYFGRKWVFAQLSRIDSLPTKVYEEFADYLLGRWADSANQPNIETNFLNWVQTNLLVAQIFGWESELNLPGIEDWPSTSQRNPLFFPIRLTKGILLNSERNQQLLVNEVVAKIWLNGGMEDKGLLKDLPPERIGHIEMQLKNKGLLI